MSSSYSSSFFFCIIIIIITIILFFLISASFSFSSLSQYFFFHLNLLLLLLFLFFCITIIITILLFFLFSASSFSFSSSSHHFFLPSSLISLITVNFLLHHHHHDHSPLLPFLSNIIFFSFFLSFLRLRCPLPSSTSVTSSPSFFSLHSHHYFPSPMPIFYITVIITIIIIFSLHYHLSCFSICGRHFSAPPLSLSSLFFPSSFSSSLSLAYAILSDHYVYHHHLLPLHPITIIFPLRLHHYFASSSPSLSFVVLFSSSFSFSFFISLHLLLSMLPFSSIISSLFLHLKFFLLFCRMGLFFPHAYSAFLLH